MTGEQLRQLLVNKWGCAYDICLRRTQGKVFLQIMWKYLGQASFPKTESEYMEHLNAVAQYLQAWGATERTVEAIEATRERPRTGKAVSIPIELGERAQEWMV
ncbi:DUF3067 family protein [Geitlerinema sp. PCC 9228]|uniref:DUF3067 family protein n=1 Tax=Geitlerinema sp. PCC 9228 TaxID=111611 RepID=UPI0008F9C255|nr:DUF3067 family protein [Geitlerinema sp. PCC 9228]